MNDNETVREVCAEMYKGVKDWRGERVGVFDNFADRILTAYGREMAAKDKEVTRLKAALKPVIEHDTLQYGHQRQQPSIVVAVREAQRMMREGGEK